MKTQIRILVSSFWMALAPLAVADDNHGQANVAQKIASSFVNLAGSKENALALVIGLRNGTDVTLKTVAPVTPPPTTTPPTTTPPAKTTTTIDPPTGKMGWGNVKIALALAQDALLKEGITKPTAAQLQAALDGGTVTRADGTTAALKGVLQMRADGMGWGRIAQAGGTKLGTVMKTIKPEAAEHARYEKGDTKAAHAKDAAKAVASVSKGVTTTPTGAKAATAPVSGKGISTASGTAAGSGSRGLVTAEGATQTHGAKGHALGRGVVTATGSSGASVLVATSGRPATGAGVVTASGASSGGVSTAAGSGSGKGQGDTHGSGKGKGG